MCLAPAFRRRIKARAERRGSQPRGEEEDGVLRRFTEGGVTTHSGAEQPMQTDRMVNKKKKEKKSGGESKNQIALMFFDVLSFYYQYQETYVNSTWYL